MRTTAAYEFHREIECKNQPYKRKIFNCEKVHRIHSCTILIPVPGIDSVFFKESSVQYLYRLRSLLENETKPLPIGFSWQIYPIETLFQSTSTFSEEDRKSRVTFPLSYQINIPVVHLSTSEKRLDVTEQPPEETPSLRYQSRLLPKKSSVIGL